MLTLSLKVGQVLELGDLGTIRLEQKSGQQVRISFDLPTVNPIRPRPLPQPGPGFDAIPADARPVHALPGNGRILAG